MTTPIIRPPPCSVCLQDDRMVRLEPTVVTDFGGIVDVLGVPNLRRLGDPDVRHRPAAIRRQRERVRLPEARFSAIKNPGQLVSRIPTPDADQGATRYMPAFYAHHMSDSNGHQSKIIFDYVISFELGSMPGPPTPMEQHVVY